MRLEKILVLPLVLLLQMSAGALIPAVAQGPSPTPDPDAPAARKIPCSTAEFPYFFRVFIRGLDDLMPRSAVRKAHVWQQVQVRSYKNPRRLLALVKQQDYDSFRIGLLNNLWIYSDPTVTSYSDAFPRLDVKFKTINKKKVRVEYIQAEYAAIPNSPTGAEKLIKTIGKPGAYIFEHRNSCWRLTQELR
jgi:hypothetical protein